MAARHRTRRAPVGWGSCWPVRWRWRLWRRCCFTSAATPSCCSCARRNWPWWGPQAALTAPATRVCSTTCARQSPCFGPSPGPLVPRATWTRVATFPARPRSTCGSRFPFGRGCCWRCATCARLPVGFRCWGWRVCYRSASSANMRRTFTACWARRPLWRFCVRARWTGFGSDGPHARPGQDQR